MVKQRGESINITMVPLGIGLGGNNLLPLRTILFMVSLYLSFKVNNGFEITSFIACLFVPSIYIAYILWREGIDFIWVDSLHKEDNNLKNK